MTPPRGKFKSVLAPDEPLTESPHGEIADAVNAVADAQNVGSMVRPQDAPLSTANVTALHKKEKSPRKPSRAEEGKLSVMVPVYLLEAIDKKRTRNKTKRFIVLQAFKEAGYEVREADFMEDGRRGRE